MAKPTDEQIKLPDFTVPMVRNLNGIVIEGVLSLQELVQNGHKGLILYFYPRDNTPGCTTQATDFTAHLNEFDNLGYDIIGVSRDSIESHKKFIDNHDLQITLISDEDEKLCHYFDVIREKNMYGKKTLGLVRSAFVFDKDGKLTHAQRNLRAKGYADRLLESLPHALPIASILPHRYNFIISSSEYRMSQSDSANSSPQNVQNTRNVQVAIIGAGTAGQNAFHQVNRQTDDVVIINSGFWTTTCATVGCMPSKLLIASAERAYHAKHSAEFGVEAEVKIDGKQVMKRVQSERDRFAGFVQDNVDSWGDDKKIDGKASINKGGIIEVTNENGQIIQLIQAEKIIIATGTTPFIPEGWADDLGDAMLTSDTIFELPDLPKSLAVIGAGAIGLELAQAMHRLGVDVTLFNRVQKVGGIKDDKVNQKAIDCLGAELTLKLDSDIDSVGNKDGQAVIYYTDSEGNEQTWQGEKVLLAVGRRAYLKDLGVEHLGVTLDDKGSPKDLDELTAQVADFPVYVIGDANGRMPLLHVASNEGFRSGRAVMDEQREDKEDFIRPPTTPMSVVFCEPQIASVGRSLSQLDDDGEDYVIGEVKFDNQGRSRVMGVNCGLLRIYACKRRDIILGANMVAPDAEYIAHILASAITGNMTVTEMLASPFYHPTILAGLRTALRDVQEKMNIDYQKDCVNDE